MSANVPKTKVISTGYLPKLHYSIQGSGPPLLFLHGIPTSSLLWDKIAEKLSSDFTIICPDLPGWGKSPPINKKGLDLLSEVVAMIDELGKEIGVKFNRLIGHDAGAVVAAHYAITHGDNVDDLVLMAAAIWPDINIPWPMRVLRTPIWGDIMSFLLKPMIFRHLGLMPPYRKLYTNRYRSSFSYPFRGPLGGLKLARQVRWGKRSKVLAPLAANLKSIKARTLIIHSSGDSAVPYPLSLRSSEAIPNCRLLELDATHFVPLTHPDLLAEHLNNYFTHIDEPLGLKIKN